MKRTGYRISRNTLYQTLVRRNSIHKVTIIIRAGNKMSVYRLFD